MKKIKKNSIKRIKHQNLKKRKRHGVKLKQKPKSHYELLLMNGITRF